MMRVSRGNKGFTLIELLIVVAIIGILAAIAIPAYSGYTSKSKVSGIVNAMGAMKNAVAAYYTESGGLPAATVGEAAITGLFGVAPPTQYATAGTWRVDWNAATFDVAITAAVDSSKVSGVTGNLVLTGHFANNPATWDWIASSVPQAYVPKSN